MNVIFLTKKKYVGTETKTIVARQIVPKNLMYITKGVASVRGDTIPFLKRIYEDVKVKILAKISFEEIHEIITKIFQGFT